MSDSERNLDAVQDTIFAILNEQMQWEQNSYDWKVGAGAVSHARGAVTALFESERPETEHELIQGLLQVLEKVQDAQQANAGEYSSGASTIGSIMGKVRHRLLAEVWALLVEPVCSEPEAEAPLIIDAQIGVVSASPWRGSWFKGSTGGW